MGRRIWASAALLLLVAAVAFGIVLAVSHFPRGISVILCLAAAAQAAWFAIRRRGAARIAGLLAGVSLFGGAIALMFIEGKPGLVAIAAVLLAGSVLAGRRAYRVHVQLPRAPTPKRPVLFYNPKSGGGKAERFQLADEARRRGIEPIELRPGEDLEALVRDAVRRGADGLAMAGGDGSQAIVAMVAAELGLPYACIPSGTRNHFALDLGVDRNAVVSALDAFVDGGERVVDLAEVNDRVFVNNVSLGLYAEAVQRKGYREAKIRTILDTVPEVLGPEAQPPQLRWSGPDGAESGAALLISNNRYRLGRVVGSGTRPRLDRGQLGIAVLGPMRKHRRRGESARLGVQQWATSTFELDSDRPVPAGIDGEAAMLEPPVRFRSRPRALRVRIAPTHPGASPSALVPESELQAIAMLARFILGREGEPEGALDDGPARESAADLAAEGAPHPKAG